MHPVVHLRTPAGLVVELGPGDMIGRSERAALCLSEPHISEAHAMVSLRGGELRLLALRGRFSVDGKATSQVALQRGQRIVLASRTALEIVDVRLPTEVLAIASEDFGPHIFASVTSLRVPGPSSDVSAPTFVTGFVPDADAVFWTLGDRLHVRIADAPARELCAGDELAVGPHRFSIVRTPLLVATHAPTQESVEVGAPLHLILNYDTVHLIAGPYRLGLDGIAARLSVVDDGVGLGDRDPWSSGGLGLFDIRERVTYLGGRMQLDSTATGTHVILDVPLEHHGTPEGP